MIKRTHTCGELTINQLDSQVSINGWISKIRDLGGLIFIDLRDRYGITQIFFNEKTNQDIFNNVKKLGKLVFIVSQPLISTFDLLAIASSTAHI